MTDKKRRGAMLTGLAGMQSIGILIQGLIMFVLLGTFKSLIQSDLSNFDIVWRISLSIGMIPGLLALLLRYNLPESPRFTVDVRNDYEKAYHDVELTLRASDRKKIESEFERFKPNRPTFREFFAFFSTIRHLKVLVGVCVSRFVINAIFYGISLNSGLILNTISQASSNHDAFATVSNHTLAQIAVALGTLPGYL